MPAKTLDQLIADRDYPQDVADAVRNEVAKSGHEARILTGELHLPSRQDAIHWFDRIHQRFGLNEDQKALHARVAELEQQLKLKLEGQEPWVLPPSSTPQEPPVSTR